MDTDELKRAQRKAAALKALLFEPQDVGFPWQEAVETCLKHA